MRHLIDRFLDGDLTEEEARSLQEALDTDPELDAELRSWERMLSAAAEAESGRPSADFTDRVMRRAVPARSRFIPATLRFFGPRWDTRLAWAAALILTFGLGAITAHLGGRVLNGPPAGPVARTSSGSAESVSAAFSPEEMRIVRLVYAPRDPSVETVHVAGTFNDWNPQDISMERKGDLWTAILILPRGTYEYMFVEDETNWVTDPLALQTRDDGFGRENAVLDLTL